MLHSVSGYVKLTARTPSARSVKGSASGVPFSMEISPPRWCRGRSCFFPDFDARLSAPASRYPPFGEHRPVAVVQQMGHYEQLRRVHSRWPVPVPRALAGGLFSSGTFFLEFVGGSIWCALGMNARRSLARCLC